MRTNLICTALSIFLLGGYYSVQAIDMDQEDFNELLGNGAGMFDVNLNDGGQAYTFTEDIIFPDPADIDNDFAVDDIVDGTYTLTIPAGVTITMNDDVSLTINTVNLGGGDEAVGRIVAQGVFDNEIIFQGQGALPAAGDWDKITIDTNPPAANILTYCEIMHGGDTDAAGDNEITVLEVHGEADITYCLIHDNGEGNPDMDGETAGDAVVHVMTNGGEPIEFGGNEIYDNTGYGTWFDLIDGNSDEVSNNKFYDNDIGVTFHIFDHEFCNNLIYDNNGDQVHMFGGIDDIEFYNNTVIGDEGVGDAGISINANEWVTTMSNNIIMDCDDGITYTEAADPAAISTFSNIFNCTTDVTNVVEGNGSIDAEPNFDDEPLDDFHLQIFWDAGLANPCWDTGELDANNMDPDWSRADMGAYGGALANAYGNDDWAPRMPFAPILAVQPIDIPGPHEFWVAHDMDWASTDYVVVEDSVTFRQADNTDWTFAGAITANGTTNGRVQWVGNDWDGIYFDSNTNIDSTSFDYCNIENATYGIKLTGATDTSSDRVLVDNTTIDNCGVGIYASNSRLKISNSTITNSNASGTFGAGVYLTTCSSGKVILDNNTISDNGTGATYASAGVYLNSADPEMIWNTIEDNSGCGVACIGSTPDLNTYLTSSDQPNTIQTNGGVHSGSDGSEIYLASSSYPDVNYNNIIHYSGGAVGYMIYKNSTNNTGALDATNCYWGATPTDGFFYWGSGTAIDYSSYSGTLLSSAEEYAAAMRLWERGEFEEAARHFRNCVADTGAIGINSIHYLTGCTGEQENGNFRALRIFLQETADEHEDDRVAMVAARFSTHCLTEQGLFDDAMEEYDERCGNAGNVQDSISALIDYLAVEELNNGGHVDAYSSRDIASQISQLMRLLDESNELADAESLTPMAYSLNDAFPNPFNSTTTIGFNLPDDQHVSLQVFDLTGRLVQTLVDERLVAGRFTTAWNANLQSAGVYFYRLQTGSFQQTKKLTLIK